MRVWILVQMSISYPIVATQSTRERFSLPLALERERGGTAGVRVRHAAIVVRELASYKPLSSNFHGASKTG